MQYSRPEFAPDPMRFGRARARTTGSATAETSRIFDDLKLFAGTFAAGFLFVSILIG